MKLKIAAVTVVLTVLSLGCASTHTHATEAGGMPQGKPCNVHGEPISGLDLEFPKGIFRAIFTVCQTPLEIPRAATVILSADSEDTPMAGKILTLPITLPIGGGIYCAARVLAGGFDLLTLGTCGEAFYGNLIAPLIWEEQWVGTIMPTEKCIERASMRDSREIPAFRSDGSVEASDESVSELPEESAAATPAVKAETQRDSRYCGDWETVIVGEVGIRVQGNPVQETLTTTKTRYSFFSDGSYRTVSTVAGKEDVRIGKWWNDGENLVMRSKDGFGKEFDVVMRPIWVSDDEVEMRIGNLAEFERKMSANGKLTASNAHYDDEGILHIDLRFKNGTTGYQKLRPQVFSRIKAD